MENKEDSFDKLNRVIAVARSVAETGNMADDRDQVLQIGSAFQSIDEVQKMIEQLKKVEENMKKESSSPENTNSKNLPCGEDGKTEKTAVVSNGVHDKNTLGLDDIDLIDLSLIGDVDDWKLTEEDVSIAEAPSFLDHHLTNIRLSLVNYVKAAINEDKEKATVTAVAATKSKSRPVTESPLRRPDLCLLDSPTPSPIKLVSQPRIKLSANAQPLMSPLQSSAVRYKPSLVSDADLEIETPGSPIIYASPMVKSIDSRTYTRPKKSRSHLDTSMKLFESHNRTITLENHDEDSEMLGQPSMILDTTMTMEKHPVNMNETYCNPTPISMGNDLNTTVVVETHHNGKPRSAHGKRVTRNLSYIIRRESESPQSSDEQIMNNTYDADSGLLNTTYTQRPNDEEFLSSPSDSNNSLNNSSMEALQSRARDQERSLRMATTPKSASRPNNGHNNILDLHEFEDAPRRPGRTSSTDTYCVQSNPDSPGSSGLSSPLESQSRDDIPSAGDGVGRSMPNLAIIKGMSGPNTTFSLAPSSNLQQRSHHISDSRLSRSNMPSRPSSSGRFGYSETTSNSRFRSQTASSGHFSSGTMTVSGNRALTEQNQGPFAVSNRAINAGTKGNLTDSQKPSLSNMRRAGLPQPRYTTGSTENQPRYTMAPPASRRLPPSHEATARQLMPGENRNAGVPRIGSGGLHANAQIQRTGRMVVNNGHDGDFNSGVPRIQSRIPAPGSLSRTRTRTGGVSRDMENGRRVPDWRDGCY